MIVSFYSRRRFTDVNINSETTGTLLPTRGGTGLTTYNTGDIIYADGYNSLTTLPIGTDQYVLTVDGYVPSWKAVGSITDSTVIKAGKKGQITPGMTAYLTADFSEDSAEAMAVHVVTKNGTLRGMRVLAGTAPGTGNTVTFTARLNGLDTTITATLSGATYFATDLVNSAAVSTNDVINVKFTTSDPCNVQDVLVTLEIS